MPRGVPGNEGLCSGGDRNTDLQGRAGRVRVSCPDTCSRPCPRSGSRGSRPRVRTCKGGADKEYQARRRDQLHRFRWQGKPAVLGRLARGVPGADKDRGREAIAVHNGADIQPSLRAELAEDSGRQYRAGFEGGWRQEHSREHNENVLARRVMADWAKIKFYWKSFLGSQGSTLEARSTFERTSVSDIHKMP